jgi:hypothetical protein
MKNYSTMILRLAIILAAIIVLAICGGAAWQAINMNPSSDYLILSHVLLAGTCLAAVPCYIALYQSYKLLGYIDAGSVFSDLSVKALKLIMRSAFVEFLFVHWEDYLSSMYWLRKRMHRVWLSSAWQ